MDQDEIAKKIALGRLANIEKEGVLEINSLKNRNIHNQTNFPRLLNMLPYPLA
jgi:hypothetical protein